MADVRSGVHWRGAVVVWRLDTRAQLGQQPHRLRVAFRGRGVDWCGAELAGWRLDTRTELGQQPHHLHVALLRRDEDWRGASIVLYLDTCTELGQHPHHLHVAFLCS